MKHILSIILTILLVCGLFSGCTSSENDASSASVQKDAVEQPETETSAVQESEGTDSVIVESDSDFSGYDVNTTIMGKQRISKEAMIQQFNVAVANLRSSFPQFYIDRNVTLDDFVQIYIEEGTVEGVRPEIAFAQMMVETGCLQFGRQVSIRQFNFAGLGATDSNAAAGADFSIYGDNATGIRMGIRAQIQHLKGYASDKKLVNECVDPRFSILESCDKRNTATMIGDLGNGNWAMDSNYAHKLLTYLTGMEE